MNAKRGKLFLDLIHYLAGFCISKSGFQCPVDRIPQAKISWILESGLPYMRRNRGAHHQSPKQFLPRYKCLSDQAHSLCRLLIKLIHNDQIHECGASSKVHLEYQALYNAWTVL